MAQTATMPAPTAHDVPRVPALIRIPSPDGAAFDDDLQLRLDADHPGWRFEIGCDGELVINMGSGGVTSDIELELAQYLGAWRTSGGGRARTSSGGYWLGGRPQQPPRMEPDLSWISPERYDALPAEHRRGSGYWAVCPDFVVEIKSPSDDISRQRDRMALWMHFGARLGWLIDPEALTVWIYRPGRDVEMLERPATLSGEDVLEGLTVEMSYVWQLAEEASRS